MKRLRATLLGLLVPRSTSRVERAFSSRALDQFVTAHAKARGVDRSVIINEQIDLLKKREAAIARVRANPLFYALLRNDMRTRGRPPKITLAVLARGGVPLSKRPPGRPKVARALEPCEVVGQLDEFKREYVVPSDKAALRLMIDEYAANLGGRSDEWKERRLRQWQSQVSRARQRAALSLRRPKAPKPHATYSGLDKFWK